MPCPPVGWYLKMGDWYATCPSSTHVYPPFSASPSHDTQLFFEGVEKVSTGPVFFWVEEHNTGDHQSVGERGGGFNATVPLSISSLFLFSSIFLTVLSDSHLSGVL